jgi:hypothetical protein
MPDNAPGKAWQCENFYQNRGGLKLNYAARGITALHEYEGLSFYEQCERVLKESVHEARLRVEADGGNPTSIKATFFQAGAHGCEDPLRQLPDCGWEIRYTKEDT